MHLTLIRYILISFLVTSATFIVACLVALSSLEQVTVQLTSTSTVAVLETVRNSQFLIMILCLFGLLGGLVAMAFAAHQASRIMVRLRQATRYLGDVVLDEMSASEFLTASDGLDREIQEMMLKIKDSQQRYLDASPLTRLPGNLAIEQVLQGKMDHGEKFAL